MDYQSNRVDPKRLDQKTGSSKTRWRDDLTRQLGPAWSRLTKDRYLWHQSSRGSSVRNEFSPDDDDYGKFSFYLSCSITHLGHAAAMFGREHRFCTPSLELTCMGTTSMGQKKRFGSLGTQYGRHVIKPYF